MSGLRYNAQCLHEERRNEDVVSTVIETIRCSENGKDAGVLNRFFILACYPEFCRTSVHGQAPPISGHFYSSAVPIPKVQKKVSM